MNKDNQMANMDSDKIIRALMGHFVKSFTSGMQKDEEGMTEKLKTVLGAFQEVKQQLIDHVQSTNSTTHSSLMDVINTIEIDIKNLISTEKDGLKNEIQGFFDTVSREIKRVEAMIPAPADFTEIDQRISTLPIISIEDVSKELPSLGVAVRDGLEKLEGDERLDQSAIKGLAESLEAIRKIVASINVGRGGGGKKITYVKRQRLTDQCNGSLKAFVLPLDTVDVIGVFGTEFPVNYDPYNSSGGDWSFTGRTLTLASGVPAPETGQTLWALIEVMFY